MRPRRGHRRGLVVEIAPNVVDATAVDMSNSPDSDDDLELDVPADNEVVFNWIDFDEEGDHDKEATLLDALEKDLAGSPEVPAVQVDPTALGFARKMNSGWARVWTQNPRVRVRMHNHHQMLKTSCRCVHPSEEQEDFKVRTQNRFEVLAQEIRNVKPELEAFDVTMADSDTKSAEVPPPRVRGKLVLVSGAQQVEVPTQEPESETKGCPLEQESLEDNESEQAAEEEDVECGEPVQDILFVPERRSMATGFESLDMVDLERCSKCGRWS